MPVIRRVSQRPVAVTWQKHMTPRIKQRTENDTNSQESLKTSWTWQQSWSSRCFYCWVAYLAFHSQSLLLNLSRQAKNRHRKDAWSARPHGTTPQGEKNVAGPNCRYRCDGRVVGTYKSEGALGDDPSREVLVLKCGGLHLGVTELVRTKKEKRVLVLFTVWVRDGTENGLELSVVCLSIMFFAVKSWNFVGLICLLKGFYDLDIVCHRT